MKNPNCDNDYCEYSNGQIRVLPTGGDSNALLCRACYLHEMRFRAERNKELAENCKFKIPMWETLLVYTETEE